MGRWEERVKKKGQWEKQRDDGKRELKTMGRREERVEKQWDEVRVGKRES